jgi:SAM-dependent methyltransferase
LASRDSNCAACGNGRLEVHLRVGGEMGEEGLIPTTDRFGSALSDIVRCTSCGHMQLQLMPEEAELAEAYGEAEDFDYVEEEQGQRATADWLLSEVERWVEPGSLLDLGCWVGFLLAQAEDRGWDGVGVEPSEFASRFARERLGLDVRTGGLLDVALEPGFDAVVMGDVIEHLPDPALVLDRVNALLAEDGVLALALPDAGSRLARVMGRRWWSVIPTHVQYFTRSSLGTLLERQGFTVLRVTTAPKTFTVRYYLQRIGGYREELANALVGGAGRFGLADRLWAPDFRDRMLVIARRGSSR